MRPSAFIIATAYLAALSQGAPGQSVPLSRLPPANATLSGDFMSLNSIRELSDGRVLLGDERGKRVVVGDFRTGRVAQVWPFGAVRGEYTAGV